MRGEEDTGLPRTAGEQRAALYRSGADRIEFRSCGRCPPNPDWSCRTRACRWFPGRLGRQAAEDAAEASFPPLKFKQGQEQLTASEIRPQCRRKVEFRIGQLPEEKVTDAGFTARADQEIGVGQIVGVQALLHVDFVDVLYLKFPVLSFPNQCTDRIYNLGTPAVTESNRQVQLVEMRRFLLGCPHPLKGRGRKRIGAAVRSKPHALFDQLVALRGEVVLEQSH